MLTEYPHVPNKGEHWVLLLPKGEGYEVEIIQLKGGIVNFVHLLTMTVQSLELSRFCSHFRPLKPVATAPAAP